MLDHISIGVRDLARSKAFYDAVLGQLGWRRLLEDEGTLGYGGGQVSFWVVASKSPVAANEASGLHICFTAPSRQSVDAFHAEALGKGGQDNGGPGLRPDRILCRPGAVNGRLPSPSKEQNFKIQTQVET